MRRTRFVALCSSLLLVAAFFTGGATRAAEPVNIALILPITGPNASVGEMCVNAARMAADDINASGGIKSLGGAKVNLVIGDSTNDPPGALTTTERILSSNNVAGAFGVALSPLTTAALPVFVKHHVPVVTSSISDKLVTPENGGYLFMIAPRGSMFGNQQVEFLKALNSKYNMGITKAAILYVDNPYGQSTAKGIEDLAGKVGLQIVLNSAYPADITDASPLVAKIQQSGAQVLFPVSYITDAQLLINALRSANSRVVIVGGGAGFIWPPIGKALGERVNGLVSVASWNLNSKNVLGDKNLVAATRRYREKYGTFMPEQAGEAYAGVWTLAAAIETARSADPQKVRDALAKLDLRTTGARMMQPGEIQFDANGANTKVEPVIIQWQKGIPVTVWPPDLATAAFVRP